MKIIEKDDGIYIEVIYESPVKSEGKKKWMFKEFTTGNFLKLEVTEKDLQGDGVVAKHAKPYIFMINAMMIKGDKIGNKTPQRIFSYLKRELTDFLA